MIIQFLTQIQDVKKLKSYCNNIRRNSIGTTSTSYVTSATTSSSYPNSRPSTPKRQSPVLNAIHNERSACSLKLRSESSDRSTVQRVY